MFAVGLAVRIVLLRKAPGPDFVVWDKAALATLNGVNIYVHHPAYPGGPFAYVPLFLYLELPFRWLAVHTHSNFALWGRAPMVAGDIAAGWLIASEVARGGGSRRMQTAAAGMFLLNPLVLYDGAWYGRFDGLTCAVLLFALRMFHRHGAGSARSATWYAMAVALKTFPGFAFAGVFAAARGRRFRLAVVGAAVIVILSLPYLGSPQPYVHDLVVYNATKTPQGLSWQTLLPGRFDAEDVQLVGEVLLAAFAVGTVVLTRLVDLDRYVALTLALFLCCSKVVLDQYLIWPMPWLAIAAVTEGGAAAASSAVLLLILTIVGTSENSTTDPLGRSPAVVNVGLPLACAVYLVANLYDTQAHRRKRHLIAAHPAGNQP